MLESKENITQLVAKFIFVALFFVVLYSAIGKSEPPTNPTILNYGLNSELHSSSAKATIAAPFQLPAFQKNLITSTDVKGFVLYNYKFKITAYNSNIRQQFSFLRNTSTLLKPLSTCRFYYHLFHIDASDDPALS